MTSQTKASSWSIAGQVVKAVPSAWAVGLRVPQNLVATAVSQTQIDLTWSGVPDANAYDIERDSSLLVSGHTTNSYSDTGLAVGSEHTYRVRAVRGPSPWIISAVTLAVPTVTVPQISLGGALLIVTGGASNAIGAVTLGGLSAIKLYETTSFGAFGSSTHRMVSYWWVASPPRGGATVVVTSSTSWQRVTAVFIERTAGVPLVGSAGFTGDLSPTMSPNDLVISTTCVRSGVASTDIKYAAQELVHKYDYPDGVGASFTITKSTSNPVGYMSYVSYQVHAAISLAPAPDASFYPGSTFPDSTTYPGYN